MKKPSNSKVIIITHPPQNQTQNQEEVIHDNVPVEGSQAPQAPAEKPAEEAPRGE